MFLAFRSSRVTFESIVGPFVDWALGFLLSWAFFIPWKTIKVEEFHGNCLELDESWQFSGIGWAGKLLELRCKNPVTKMCSSMSFLHTYCMLLTPGDFLRSFEGSCCFLLIWARSPGKCVTHEDLYKSTCATDHWHPEGKIPSCCYFNRESCYNESWWNAQQKTYWVLSGEEKMWYGWKKSCITWYVNVCQAEPCKSWDTLPPLIASLALGPGGVRAQAVEQPQVQRTQRDAAVQHQKLLQKKQLQKEVRS